MIGCVLVQTRTPFSSFLCLYGTCTNVGSTFTCSCIAGFTGANCQTGQFYDVGIVTVWFLRD